MRHLIGLTLGLSVILLAGCTNNTELTLLADQKWELKQNSSFDPQLIPRIGASIEIIQGLNIDIDASDAMDPISRMGMDALVQRLQSQGYDARWEKRGRADGQIEYEVVINGRGYDRLTLLSSTSSGATAGLPNTPIQVLNNSDGTLSVSVTYPQASDLSFLANNTVKIRGGKIVASNATRVDDNTAIWLNTSGRLDAMVTPYTPSFEFPTLALIVGGGVVLIAALGGGTYLFLRSRHGGISRSTSRNSSGRVVRAHRLPSRRTRR